MEAEGEGYMASMRRGSGVVTTLTVASSGWTMRCRARCVGGVAGES